MVYRYTSPLRLVAFIGFGIFATSSRPRRTSPPASKSTRPRAFEDGFGWGSHNILYGKNMCSIWLWTYFDKLLSQCFFAFKQTPIWLFHNSADSRVWYWGMTPVWLDQAMSGRTILELPSTPCAFKVQATSLQKWTTSLALCEFCYKLLLYVFSLSSILWASRCYIQHAHSSFSARLFYQILSQSYQTLKLFLDTFSWNWLLDRKNFEIKFD
jgi:hypothetical protein